MKKTFKLLPFLLCVFALSTSGCDSQKFSYHDFKNYEELRGELKTRFPLGTKKEDVDAILVKQAGGTVSQIQDLKKYRYRSGITLAFPKDGILITITYDDDNRVENIRPYIGGDLY